LQQVAGDLAKVKGERAVVLVTDGIESCNGNAPAAARALQKFGHVPVHVIGFGLGGADDQDLASLRAIANASGGKFLTASSASELRDALTTTVGTSYQVWSGETRVASGSLGANEILSLSAGEYRVQLDSTPVQEVSVTLAGEQRTQLVFDHGRHDTTHRVKSEATDYKVCEQPVADMQEGLPAAPALDSAEQGSGLHSASHASAVKEQRVSKLEIDDGSVEIWQNLRPRRKTDWGVIVRHRTVKDGSSMIWSGNDFEEAESVAKSIRDAMQKVKPVPGEGAP
jgi:hypothetical protein